GLGGSDPGGKAAHIDLSINVDMSIHTRYGDRMATTGLEGVVAATTALSHVDGERGELVIAGYQVDELAGQATFEETTWLLWHGELPSEPELDAFRAALAGDRAIPEPTLVLLRECAARRLDAMD